MMLLHDHDNDNNDFDDEDSYLLYNTTKLSEKLVSLSTES